MEDKQIIELFLSRSEQAIYEAEIKYGRYCHKIAFNILGNDEDSEECVNDALMRLWSSIPPNEPQSLLSFVGRITRNLALDRLRQKNSDKRGGGEIPLVLDEISEFVSGGDQIERLHESQEITDALNKFLGDPPRRYASGGGECKMECAVFEIDCETGKCVSAEALRIE